MQIVEIIPFPWCKYVQHMPLLADAKRWELLRKWGLSEVWRVTTATGQTWIAKRSSGSMAVELPIYRELLRPLHVPRPALLASWQGYDEQFSLLEDVGLWTLEQRPQAEHFVEAARVLARLRCVSIVQLPSINAELLGRYRVSADYYLLALDYLLHHTVLHPEQKAVLATVADWLPARLQDLYRQLPLALCHNDYHVKNLVLREDTLVPIDWAMAYLSPYLGDMYSLTHAGSFRNVETSLLLAAYEEEVRRWAAAYVCVRPLLDCPLHWQIALGAVCILITSIRWILTEAMYELPESKKWIPAMMRNIEYYTRQLQQA